MDIFHPISWDYCICSILWGITSKDNCFNAGKRISVQLWSGLHALIMGIMVIFWHFNDFFKLGGLIVGGAESSTCSFKLTTPRLINFPLVMILG